MKSILSVVSTVFWVGRVPFMPGTLGSVVGVLIGFVLQFNTISLFVVSVILFVMGYVCTDLYEPKSGEKDPREVVIDELVGMLFTLMICFSLLDVLLQYDTLGIRNPLLYSRLCTELWTVLLSFLLFRYFDITKPLMIGFIDKRISGGLGIMLDDVVAAVWAGIVFAILLPASCYWISLYYFIK